MLKLSTDEATKTAVGVKGKEESVCVTIRARGVIHRDHSIPEGKERGIWRETEGGDREDDTL